MRTGIKRQLESRELHLSVFSGVPCGLRALHLDCLDRLRALLRRRGQYKSQTGENPSQLCPGGTQMRYRNVTQEASFGGRSCNAVAAEEPDFEGGVTKQTRQCSNECGFANTLKFFPFEG